MNVRIYFAGKQLFRLRVVFWVMGRFSLRFLDSLSRFTIKRRKLTKWTKEFFFYMLVETKEEVEHKNDIQ